MAPMIAAMRRHSVVSYFVLAFATSWAIWIPMALEGVRVYPGSAWPTHVPGLFGPMAAAFLMSALLGGGHGVKEVPASSPRGVALRQGRGGSLRSARQAPLS